jgi:hypothetical protein
MKPLQAIAMGLVIVALIARFGDYDGLVDPLGWVLVLVGLRGLPDATPLLGALWTAAVVAAVVSVPLWIPASAEWLDDADPSLAWAANLPKFAFVGLLAHALAGAASAAGERGPAGWLRMIVTATAFVVAAPVLVFGADVDALADPADIAAQVVLLVDVWLLFSYAGRTWAGAAVPELPNRRPDRG